jgi:hypothetical protein
LNAARFVGSFCVSRETIHRERKWQLDRGTPGMVYSRSRISDSSVFARRTGGVSTDFVLLVVMVLDVLWRSDGDGP